MGDNFSHAEIGELMLIADVDADGQVKIDDLLKFLATYSTPH